MAQTADQGRVVEVDPLVDRRWDEFVLQHPRASAHHLGAWAAILRACYGYRPRYIALVQDGGLRGVLPLVSSGRRLSGSRLSSLPTAKAAGPLAESPEQEVTLMAAARAIKQREGLGSVLVRSHVALDSGPLRIHSVTATQLLKLDRPPERLMESYKETSKNLYRSIRKAHKSGLTVQETRSDRDLRDWYRLYLLTIRRHRNLPRRLRQLEEAKARLGPAWRLVTVKKDGAVIAGGVFHDIAGTVELVYNASDHGALALRPNHALYWHMITDSSERGRTAFDFGVSAHETLERFKAQWGTVAQNVYFYNDSAAGSDTPTGSAPVPSQPSRRGEWTARARQLAGDVLEASPPTVTRALGAVAYRLI